MAKAAEPTALLVVLESFIDATGTEYHKGEPIESDHPTVRKHPKLFGPFRFPHPVDRGAEPVVEQATAAPGEKRAAR